MDTLPTRALTSQLADDLAWLEQHARRQPEQGQAASQLRLAAGLVRNVLGPYLDGQASSPLHVVVVGGAGAGKSTVANMLAGAVVAEANPQAGFTRHPIAYTSMAGPINWAAHVGFLGPLVRLTQPSPSSLDQDVYQVRRVPADPSSFDLLREWIVWDCPDMTTWAAENYVPRLIEAAALADVVVYVASDERYNDEIPTKFLEVLLQTGKPVICCLMKMREADMAAMAAHFQKEVVDALPGGLGKGVMGVLPIPFLTPQQIADPIREAPRYRIPLLNQVAVLGNPAVVARKRTVGGSVRYLTGHQAALTAAARPDMLALQEWQNFVRSGQGEFEERYRREYLTTEKFRGFDEALVRLLELLELPGVGQLVSGALYIVRTPYRLLRGWLVQTFSRPDTPSRPEQPVLQDALNGWLDLLHRESARRGGEHAVWDHINRGYQSSGFPVAAREEFGKAYRNYQASLSLEVDRTARAIYEDLAKQPFLLNSLRGGKLAIDVALIGGVVAAGGLSWWDLVLVPVITSFTHQLVEILGASVVENHRERTRQRQQAIMQEQLAGPLGDWLARWPATGGSPFERLQTALTRLPGAIGQLEARVRQAASAHP